MTRPSSMNQQDEQIPDTVVIGAGIVGLAAAEHLQSRGRQVTLVEREAVAAGASQGNAAAFAFSEIIPMASPDVVRKAIRWFFDPLGPFAVVARDLPWTYRWLLKFLAASRPVQFKRSIETQSRIMDLAKTSMNTMVTRAGVECMVRSVGALYLYNSEASYRRDADSWVLRHRYGIEFETLKAQALHHFQPGLDSGFRVGIFVPCWQTVSDPLAFCHGLYSYLARQGVEFLHAKVKRVSADDTGVEITLAEGRSLRARHAVIAAGPWSAVLAEQLGDKVPLIAERGYNTTFPKKALELQRMLVFCDHGFVITPLAEGIRIGGASEIARLDRPANYKRSMAMVIKAKRFLPDLKTEDGEPWMGSRPATPDTLPVIGYSKASKRVVYAFGHGHLGLTQSAATGQLVSELIHGEQTSIDLSPLRADRF